MSLNADGMGSGPPYLSDSPAIAKKKATHRGKRGGRKLNKNKKKNEEEIGNIIDATKRLNVSLEIKAPASASVDIQNQPPVVHLTSPIAIATGSELHVTRNSASSQFGPGFVREWDKLPNELKVHILRFNLVEDGCGVRVDDDPVSEVPRRLLDHLAMGGDITLLSREVFYKENRFILWLIRCGRWTARLTLPHPSARPLIRTISLTTSLDVMDWKTLQKFAREAKNVYGFRNLTTVVIGIMWEPSELIDFMALLESEPRSVTDVKLAFTCELRVILYDLFDYFPLENYRAMYENLKHELEHIIVCG
jgi:hypothetical protein